MPTAATIIVIEGEADTRATLCGTLEDTGYRVIELKTGADALEMIRRSPFNVVITDIRLPDVGGMEILELAKEMNPDVAVIIMTGYASMETAADAIDQGAYAYFVKPINPDEIKTTIANALNQQRLLRENKRLVESLQQSNKLLFEANEELGIEITERKQAEDALRESEENFRRSLDDSPLGVRIFDAEGETLYANRAILDIYGYASIEELKASPAEKRLAPESHAEHLKRREKRLRGGEITPQFEMSIVHKNGEIRHLQVFRKEVLWNGKRRVQSLYQNITERKRMEEKLRESEARFSELYDEAPVGYHELDIEGRITHVNRTELDMLGYTAEEMLGRHVWDFIVEHETSSRAFATKIARTLATSSLLPTGLRR